MRASYVLVVPGTIKRGQNALRVVNVICGANSVFRARVFEQLISRDAPYAIDDMYWLAEVVRQRLGRIEYVHGARSWTIDPHRFGDWYSADRPLVGGPVPVRPRASARSPGAAREAAFLHPVLLFDTAYLLLLRRLARIRRRSRF
jgi:hypothetical protein